MISVCNPLARTYFWLHTAQKMKFSIKDLLKKFLMENFIFCAVALKETHNSFKKWPLKLWWISKKTIMEVGNITKAATFISFLHLTYINTQLLFCDSFFNIFMRQILTNYFWKLQKNMNSPFLLISKSNTSK